MFVGLNPSTANGSKNDNTITKLIKITRNNGFGGFYMMNLFALVSPYPEDLTKSDDPLGDNDGWIEKISPKCEKVIFAWGDFKEARERSQKIIEMFPDGYALIINKNGTPRHPLYVKADTKPKQYNKYGNS